MLTRRGFVKGLLAGAAALALPADALAALVVPDMPLEPERRVWVLDPVRPGDCDRELGKRLMVAAREQELRFLASLGRDPASFDTTYANWDTRYAGVLILPPLMAEPPLPHPPAYNYTLVYPTVE